MAAKVLNNEIHESILRTALEAGKDPHVAMVCWIKDCQPEQVTKEERAEIKMLNYRLLYSPDFLGTINFPVKH